MGKRKTEPVWKAFLWGNLLTFGVYLVGILLAALFVVRGTLPESAVFPVVAILCLLSTFGGGVMAVRRAAGWGSLWSALLSTAIFTGILILIGMGINGVSWGGQGGILLLCALAGGLAAALLGNKKKRRKRK